MSYYYYLDEFSARKMFLVSLEEDTYTYTHTHTMYNIPQEKAQYCRNNNLLDPLRIKKNLSTHKFIKTICLSTIEYCLEANTS